MVLKIFTEPNFEIKMVIQSKSKPQTMHLPKKLHSANPIMQFDITFIRPSCLGKLFETPHFKFVTNTSSFAVPTLGDDSDDITMPCYLLQHDKAPPATAEITFTKTDEFILLCKNQRSAPLNLYQVEDREG